MKIKNIKISRYIRYCKLYLNGNIFPESVFSLSLNLMDILSGVTERLFCILVLFDMGLLADKLFTLESFVLTEFLLDIERGRGIGTGTSVLPMGLKYF